MTRIILPTVLESDELFTNGFVIVQERRSATPRRARIWKQHEEKSMQRAPHLRTQSSFLWCNEDVDGAKGKKRKSRRAVVGTKSGTKNLIVLTKNHVIETTEHTKCVSDCKPRPPIRTLPSLYFP